MAINISDLMEQSGVQFGTSGVRGLVNDMTDEVCFCYVSAFVNYLIKKGLLSSGGQLGIAGDLRTSTPRIMNAVAAACISLDIEPVNYGYIPSPALALIGLEQVIPTIMVTGSHIPDDRNGMKFNTPLGEILKSDELGIKEQTVQLPEGIFLGSALIKLDYLAEENKAASNFYIERFINFFPENSLAKWKVGLYEHSSVSRDIFKTVLEKLGAEVISLGRTEHFVPVDTEAIRDEDIKLAKQWSVQYNLDCIISTDGDGDRPLISDEQGNWLRGDIAGLLCAQYLQADNVVTPVSSNSAVEKSNYFNQVVRTKIGSPYVIKAMQELSGLDDKTIVAYEANGGFLQYSPLKNKLGQILSPLPTRDAVIVPITAMLLAQQQEITISALLATLPQRYTYSDRLKNFPTQLSQQKISELVSSDLSSSLVKITSHFGALGKPVNLDMTDGLRITFDNDDVVHLRPSGNAPELRCYTESETESKAVFLNKTVMNIISQWNNA